MARRVLVVFGTRPEAIKLLPVIEALAARPGLAAVTCATGQHRALLDRVLAIAGLVPDLDLGVMRPGQSLDRLTARLLLGVGGAIDRLAPDLVVVQGDTATALAAALAAHHRRVPVAHVEAGLRSGDTGRPWPEEANRRLIAPLAALHFAPTAAAAAALAGEGIDPATVHVTGNTVIDALHRMRRRIEDDPALTAGSDALIERIGGRRLILATTHRRENLGGGIASIARALCRLGDRRDAAVLLPVHPNPAVAATLDRVTAGHPGIIRTDPLDYPDFVRMLARCAVVLTDSGGVQEEAPALGKPVLVLRETTERPEGVAAGTARLVGTDEDRIVAETARLLDDPAAHVAMARAHNPYGDGRAGERIAGIVANMLDQRERAA